MRIGRIAAIAIILATSASVATASDYADFRIPAHSWSRLNLALEGTFTPTLSTNEFRQDRTRQGLGALSGSWLHGHDSEHLEHSLQIIAAGSVSGRTRELDLDFPPADRRVDDDEKLQIGRESWGLAGEVGYYPGARSLGVLGRLQGSGDYAQGWESQDRFEQGLMGLGLVAQTNQSSNESWAYTYGVSASVAGRWGRVRDVTGVQRVQYVEDRLVRDRALTGPLAPDTRQRLADLFYTESKFSLVHDLPDRAFWSEFERILREDPAVQAERLDAYAIYHAGDPLVVSRGFGRMAGAFVGPVLTFAHRNDVRRSDSHYYESVSVDDSLVVENRFYSRYHHEEDDQQAMAGAEASIEQPLGLRWHLSVSGTALSDLRGIDHEVRIQSALALRYWQGERWYWDTSVNQYRTTGSDVAYYVVGWSVSYGSNVSYYLEDHVSLDFGVTGRQYHYETDDYLRTYDFRIGLSYRSGSLTAPGLFSPVRPGS